MLVTRHFSLTSETFPTAGAVDRAELDELFPVHDFVPVDTKNPLTWYPATITKFQAVGFCDWISIYQRHGAAQLPRLCDGAFLRIDAHGECVNTTLKKLRIEGSHDTSVYLRCDGETVWFEGNASRFRRPDNVFGYTFMQCIQRINALLEEHQLPPFTEGDKFITNFKSEPRSVWTGAIVTRVDMTENFATGSREDAYHFMRWLSGQQASRLKTGTHGDGETVDFGRGSRRVYSKAYLKGAELRRHAKGDAYLERLADWCDERGIVRFETTYKATKLHDMGCHYLGGFDMKQLEIDFEERKEVLSRASAEVEELSGLSKPLLSTYRMWQAGDDVVSRMSRATFFKHRKALLPYGVDIAIKSNVTQLKTKTRVIRLGPVSAPEWYELPEIERKRNGTQG